MGGGGEEGNVQKQKGSRLDLLLSGPISLICLKLVTAFLCHRHAIFFFFLPQFHFTGPSLTSMAYPKEENKEVEHPTISPASEKAQEAGGLGVERKW